MFATSNKREQNKEISNKPKDKKQNKKLWINKIYLKTQNIYLHEKRTKKKNL